MRTIIIFAMILTFIFAMVGCNANSEPDKKAVESSSANAIVDITQAEDLFEKTEDETVEKSTFAEEKTQSPATKIDTEKVSKEPIFSQTTTANTEPKQDTHTQTEPPKNEKSAREITTNTVSEVTTAIEQIEEFDKSYWMQDTIKNINIDLLIPFENHPFKKRDGIENEELKDSVKENGLLQPIIVRSFSAGTFEIISGHRRVEVCKELGIQTIPAIVRDMTKDEAVIAMVDSNLQREHLLPSEKAFAYKMKLEAIKHQGKTSCQVGAKSRTDEQISETVKDSARQVQRYIRLTHLIPELLKLVDEERIAFTPAVELSYLPENEQRMLAEEIEYTDATPSLSQAQRLRKFSEQGRLSIDTIFAVLSEEKPNQKEQVKFKTEDIRKYFPKSYTSLDMQKTIITLLEKWQKQRERNRGEAR